jgi:hypothetical protein
MKPAERFWEELKDEKERNPWEGGGGGVSHKSLTLTILGGSARSAALPFFVRLSTMFFKILCLSKIMALRPSSPFPYICIGVATYLKGFSIELYVSKEYF